MRISDWSSDVCSSDLQAGLVAAVETGAFETIGQYLALLFQQGLDGVGELDFAAGARRGLFEQLEDSAGQYIAAHHGQVRGSIGRLGFLDHVTDRGTTLVDRRGVDEAVLVGPIGRASCRERGCPYVWNSVVVGV